jgi:hypothetical protein
VEEDLTEENLVGTAYASLNEYLASDSTLLEWDLYNADDEVVTAPKLRLSKERTIEPPAVIPPLEPITAPQNVAFVCSEAIHVKQANAAGTLIGSGTSIVVDAAAEGMYHLHSQADENLVVEFDYKNTGVDQKVDLDGFPDFSVAQLGVASQRVLTFTTAEDVADVTAVTVDGVVVGEVVAAAGYVATVDVYSKGKQAVVISIGEDATEEETLRAISNGLVVGAVTVSATGVTLPEPTVVYSEEALESVNEAVQGVVAEAIQAVLAATVEEEKAEEAVVADADAAPADEAAPVDEEEAKEGDGEAATAAAPEEGAEATADEPVVEPAAADEPVAEPAVAAEEPAEEPSAVVADEAAAPEVADEAPAGDAAPATEE